MKTKDLKMTPTLRVFAFYALFALFACLSATGRAAIIAYDDFEESALGPVGGQETGFGFIEPYTIGGQGTPENSVVTNVALSYADNGVVVSGGTNALALAMANNRNDAILTRQFTSYSGDVIYFSFLFNLPTVRTDPKDDDYFCIGPDNGRNQPDSAVMHRINGGNNGLDFGIRYGGSNSEVKGVGSTISGQTYLVVLKMRKTVPGASNNFNEMSLFVNPALPYEENNTPYLTHTNNRGTAMEYLCSRIAMLEQDDLYLIDNLTVASTWDGALFGTNSPVVKPVAITPNGGAFSSGTVVSLATETPGADIWYTLDGSEPSPQNANAFLYTAPFVLDAYALVKAAASKTGMFDSAVTSAEYRFSFDWTGGGGDKLWSNPANWLGGVAPSGGEDVVFGCTNRVNNNGVNINNIISADLTISSLSYTNSNRMPSGNNGTYNTHGTEILENVTLTIDGSNSPKASLLGGGWNDSAEHQTHVRILGAGSLEVDTPDTDIILTSNSGNSTPVVYFNMSDLRSFSANVRNFFVGKGSRGRANLDLPSGADSVATVVTADCFVLGDTEGATETQTAPQLRFGRDTVMNVNTFNVAATRLSGINAASGNGQFATAALPLSPTLQIRGRDGGGSRANLKIASHGNGQTPRPVTGVIDLRGGLVDALFDSIVIAEHSGAWSSSSGNGNLSGSLYASGGTIDAESVVLGRGLYRSSDGANGTAVLNLSGTIDFATRSFIQNDMVAGMQGRLTSRLELTDGATMTVDGDFVMGNNLGAPAAVTSRIDIARSANLDIGGNVYSSPLNDARWAVMRQEIILRGGSLSAASIAVTNGVFALHGGTAVVDDLDMSSPLACVELSLNSETLALPQSVTVNGDLLIAGGEVCAVFAEGFKPKGGEVWRVVAGGARHGKFAVENIPENIRVKYNSDGFDIVCPSEATILIIR